MPEVDGTPHHSPLSDCSLYCRSDKQYYIHTFECHCGKSIRVELNTKGSYNVGVAKGKTNGWKYGICAYTDRGIWLCTECAIKAKALAQQLFELTGTPYYHWTDLINKELRDKWCDDIDAKQRENKL